MHYHEMGEIDDGPRHAGGAAEEGEDEEPGEEDDEDVGRPHPGVHEPLRVLVHVRRRHRLHVQLRHRRRRRENRREGMGRSPPIWGVWGPDGEDRGRFGEIFIRGE